MPSLTDKLRELGVEIGASHLAPGKNPASRPRDLLDALPGSWEQTPAGECFVIRKEFQPDIQHGRFSLLSIPSLRIFESLDSQAGISAIPIEDFLFIDTETTGLSGGAGTYVFLIGAAKVQSDRIELAQFFLQDPGQESAQLAALESFASSAQAVVSYNGKSFDLPRIRTRYNFHSWPDPFAEVHHLDLLHVARRLWKEHLSSCTLGELEYHLLGLERDELDIPGWKVAELFFSYLHTGDPDPLKSIFYHNEVDVLSLISLLGYTASRLSSPLEFRHPVLPDLVSIGSFLLSLQETELAEIALAAALAEPDLPVEIRRSGLLALASAHKKADDLGQALPLWLECADLNSVEASVELAKYYEHQAGDIQEAIHWTLCALNANRPDSNPLSSSDQSALDHRLQRLKRKAKR